MSSIMADPIYPIFLKTLGLPGGRPLYIRNNCSKKGNSDKEREINRDFGVIALTSETNGWIIGGGCYEDLQN